MKYQRGYIGIATAMVLSLILGLAVFTGSRDSFTARFDQLDDENKERSVGLALSCIYEALYAYAEDSSYNPHYQIISLGERENNQEETCTIDSLTISGNQLTLIVHASIGNSYTALAAQAELPGISTVSWHEITSIPP